jgi:Bifunctional DNA primase/polymerase, N-terminal
MPALTEALRYAGQGHAVLPCVVGAKQPLTSAGVADASIDPARLEQWWRWWPDANVALAARPSRLVFADLDRRPGFDGVVIFGRLLERLELDWPATRATATPSGSRHLWFTRPPEEWSRVVDRSGSVITRRPDPRGACSRSALPS